MATGGDENSEMRMVTVDCRNPIPAVDVCAAVIMRDDRYLLGQRPVGGDLAGKWEFPGGKLHADESLQECLIREIDEELSLPVHNPRFLTTTMHRTETNVVRLHFLACRIADDAVYECREHQAVGWFTLEQLAHIDLAPADRMFVTWLQRTRR